MNTKLMRTEKEAKKKLNMKTKTKRKHKNTTKPKPKQHSLSHRLPLPLQRGARRTLRGADGSACLCSGSSSGFSSLTHHHINLLHHCIHQHSNRHSTAGKLRHNRRIRGVAPTRAGANTTANTRGKGHANGQPGACWGGCCTCSRACKHA